MGSQLELQMMGSWVVDGFLKEFRGIVRNF
jgi:hypothetical protein